MKLFAVAGVALSLAAVSAFGAQPKSDKHKESEKAQPAKDGFFQPEAAASSGSVVVEGRRIDYQAVAGTLVIHPKGWDDSAKKPDADDTSKDEAADAADKDDDNPDAEASMFYVAYFKHGAPSASRPITFLFNGGPGSATVWLHMGAFGPHRVVTADDTHTLPAPYRFINNDYSLLDASDLVFIDAPGTGFSRIEGKDKEKSFYGVDADAYAFTEFVSQFLSKYGRWNSPKYLFGESYGTPRAAIMSNELEQDRDVDLNGVILLSDYLNFDMNDDSPEDNPGVDIPYAIALPTYASTAWYHHKLPGDHSDLEPFLQEVERFALTDYALALQQGADLPDAQRDAIAEKLHTYTGLPVDYIKKANLRIDCGMFMENLLADENVTVGRLDTRFSGPTMDPLAKEANYDPQSASISSAYVSAFNNYVRTTLHFGDGKTYLPDSDEAGNKWITTHQPPGANSALQNAPNVLPDLASAMKYNPTLKVMVNGGYFDLATPFFEGMYEMSHLQIPANLRSNIEYHYYRSGHMVYAHEESLKQIHDNVAAFIRKTSRAKGE
jgi:carboxypeptidase C (cathepsin A)